MDVHDINLWGMADVRAFFTPSDETGKGFPCAITWALPMNSEIMMSIQNGPNQAYADEYAQVNSTINQVSSELAAEICSRGFRSKSLAASERTDTETIKGAFPHKTAATLAGLGWIGRHCQLVTRPHGSWVRLGTVFTDMDLPCGPSKERSHCGECRRCVDACPADALTGTAWYPGIPREEIMDVGVCDQWKKKHYFTYHQGHNCGICSAVCPYGLKALKKAHNHQPGKPS